MNDLKKIKNSNISPRLRQNKNPYGESNIQHQIIVYLTKIPKSRLFRNYNCTPPVGKDPSIRRRASTLNPNGMPDLTFHHKGKTVYFEVKNVVKHKFIIKHIERLRNELYLDKNKHEKNQIRLMDDLIAIGIPCFFVSSCADVENALRSVFYELK